MIKIPSIFQVPQNFFYPQYNFNPFEEWFLNNYVEEEDAKIKYLPILWTAFLCRAQFGEDVKQLELLQWLVDTLPKDINYFSVVQFDNSVVVKLPDNIKLFAMSGWPCDYRLPLLAKIPKTNFTFEKNYFCNFIGRVETHPMRQKLIDHFKFIQPDRGYYITTINHHASLFFNILSRSTFTICIRGYGATSFRITEALSQGSIPVYISDEFLIPHGVPFENYGVLIEEKDIDRIEEILEAIPQEEIKRMQAVIPSIFETYYTYEGCKKLILQNI